MYLIQSMKVFVGVREERSVQEKTIKNIWGLVAMRVSVASQDQWISAVDGFDLWMYS